MKYAFTLAALTAAVSAAPLASPKAAPQDNNGGYAAYDNYPAEYSDYGDYGDYGTYGTYDSYKRSVPPVDVGGPAKRQTADDSPAEYSDYGDYGTYGTYDNYPSTYTTYGTYDNYKRSVAAKGTGGPAKRQAEPPSKQDAKDAESALLDIPWFDLIKDVVPLILTEVDGAPAKSQAGPPSKRDSVDTATDAAKTAALQAAKDALKDIPWDDFLPLFARNEIDGAPAKRQAEPPSKQDIVDAATDVAKGVVTESTVATVIDSIAAFPWELLPLIALNEVDGKPGAQKRDNTLLPDEVERMTDPLQGKLHDQIHTAFEKRDTTEGIVKTVLGIIAHIFTAGAE